MARGEPPRCDLPHRSLKWDPDLCPSNFLPLVTDHPVLGRLPPRTAAQAPLGNPLPPCRSHAEQGGWVVVGSRQGPPRPASPPLCRPGSPMRTPHRYSHLFPMRTLQRCSHPSSMRTPYRYGHPSPREDPPQVQSPLLHEDPPQVQSPLPCKDPLQVQSPLLHEEPPTGTVSSMGAGIP